MPRFQRSLDTVVGSNTWARENRKAVFGPTVAAVKKAFTDVGREVPDAVRQRTVGAGEGRVGAGGGWGGGGGGLGAGLPSVAPSVAEGSRQIRTRSLDCASL